MDKFKPSNRGNQVSFFMINNFFEATTETNIFRNVRGAMESTNNTQGKIQYINENAAKH